MPSIECPECRTVLYGRQADCPECGYPLSSERRTSRRIPRGEDGAAPRRPWFRIAGVCFVGAMFVSSLERLVRFGRDPDLTWLYTDTIAGFGVVAGMVLIVVGIVSRLTNPKAVGRPHPRLNAALFLIGGGATLSTMIPLLVTSSHAALSSQGGRTSQKAARTVDDELGRFRMPLPAGWFSNEQLRVQTLCRAAASNPTIDSHLLVFGESKTVAPGLNLEQYADLRVGQFARETKSSAQNVRFGDVAGRRSEAWVIDGTSADGQPRVKALVVVVDGGDEFYQLRIGGAASVFDAQRGDFEFLASEFELLRR